MHSFIEIADIQLLSYDPQAQPASNTGAGSLSAEMKTFYDMTLIDEAGANLIHDQFGQKRPIPKGSGKSIEFRKFASLSKALTPLTEGVTPNGKSLQASTVTATVSQYGDFITQTDVLELTSIDNTVVEATKLLGRQAGMTLDNVTRNILHSGLNVTYCPKVSGTTETEVTSRHTLDKTALLTVDVVQQVVAKLRAQNAPTINGKYIAVIHPYVAYDLMRDADWIDAHKYAQPDALYNGEIGEMAGVRFVQTTEAKIYSGANLAGTVRKLKVNGAVSASTSVTFDGGTVAADALIGRYVIIGGTKAKVTDNTDTTLTLDTAVTAENDSDIYPGEGGSGGLAVFGSLFMGEGAYGVSEIAGGGLEIIVKQKGSGGTSDPLDQRSSVGWKAIKTAELLIPNYLVRVESCSKRFSDSAEAN